MNRQWPPRWRAMFPDGPAAADLPPEAVENAEAAIRAVSEAWAAWPAAARYVKEHGYAAPGTRERARFRPLPARLAVALSEGTDGLRWPWPTWNVRKRPFDRERDA